MGNIISDKPQLTRGQLELLVLYGAGLRFQEIAKKEHLSYYTVRNRLDEARDRANAKNITQCVVYAIAAGLLKVQEDGSLEVTI